MARGEGRREGYLLKNLEGRVVTERSTAVSGDTVDFRFWTFFFCINFLMMMSICYMYNQ